ncbi:MAG: ferritin [Culturomica sp.]|jgi:bacterioferritin|nr:ferritin [Culturomica sp.]
MGKENLKIVKGLDVKELIKMLNSALSEEWLAYYQYWIGSRIIEGAMRPSVEKEFMVHAQEELGHAEKLVTRIIQLDGTPVLSPEEWFKLAKCKYLAPTHPYIETVLEQNLSAERCAIETYQRLADYTFGKDHTTYKIAADILEEESDHEQEIEDWLTDMAQIKHHLVKK